MREIDSIIIHCSAYPPDWMEGESAEAKVEAIRRDHILRGYDDFAYHYFIDRDGTVVKGRADSVQGAHCNAMRTKTESWNRRSLGICLAGGFGSEAGQRFHDNFTAGQDFAARGLLVRKQEQYDIENSMVFGHNQFAAKACPGFQVDEWRKGRERWKLESTTLQASVAAGAASAAGVGSQIVGALSGLSEPVQIILAVAFVAGVAGSVWIARERIKKWARGIR